MTSRIWHFLFLAGIFGVGWLLGNRSAPIGDTAEWVLLVACLIAVAVPTHVWADRQWRAGKTP